MTAVPKAEPESHDRRSLHERVAAGLRDDIMSGELTPGANLPSTAQLRTRFDASDATIQKALQLLEDERLVVGRAGAAVTGNSASCVLKVPAVSRLASNGYPPATSP